MSANVLPILAVTVLSTTFFNLSVTASKVAFDRAWCGGQTRRECWPG